MRCLASVAPVIIEAVGKAEVPEGSSRLVTRRKFIQEARRRYVSMLVC